MRSVLILLLFLALPAEAFPLVSVGSLQLPAWVERDGVRSPLRPGAELKQGDVVHVGAGGRA
ncbi:MAG: hypothetical protein AB7U30_11115 [Sulfuricellaceae bacterium]|jgi:hypothetical protein